MPTLVRVVNYSPQPVCIGFEFHLMQIFLLSFFYSGEDHHVKVWDVAAGSVLHDFTGHNDHVHNLVWLTEKLVASCSADGSIRVWDVAQSTESSFHQTSNSYAHQLSSYSVPSPWKVVHLGRGQRSGLVCVAASD